MATAPTTEINIKESEMDMKMMLSSDLCISTLQGDWGVVVNMYKTNKIARTIEISGGRGTALHVAVNDGQEDIVKDLVELITSHEEQEDDEQEVKALEMRNERGDTPLHLAASRGFKGICKLIIGANRERKHLITVKNKLGETPLFLAALTWQKQTFAYLLYVFQNDFNLANQTSDVNLQVLIRDDGDTILHSAIRREFFDLAVIIIHYYPKLHDIQNIVEGFTPLKLLANRPSAFRSGSLLIWWRRIIYNCIAVKDLDVERTLERYLNKNDVPGDPELDKRLPLNYITCYQFFTMSELADKPGLGGCNILRKEKGQRPVTDEHKILMPLPKADPETSQSHSPQKKSKKSLVPETEFKEDQLLPPNYATFVQFLKFAYLHALGIHGAGVKVIRKIKKKHKWGDQLLSALMQNPSQAYMGSGGQPTDQQYKDEEDKDEGETNPLSDPFSAYTHQKEEAKKKTQIQASKKLDPEAEENIDRKETAFLIAARNGIVEIVKMILSQIPSALHDTTSDKKNVFLVAVKYRQPLVVAVLLRSLTEQNINNLIRAVDNNENTVLHLAAETLSNETPWKIPGSAMQMMWDIKWFQYVKEQVPEHFIFRRNKGDKTPGEIFKASHKELVKESSEWLKETSESCSVVAALVAGVSFATAGTVPGGTEKGKPALEGQPAFTAFAISSLIGLCFSVTALIMFLAVLTSRKQAKDFRRNLPLKLLLGLTSLFVSIVSMFVSFCAGHFFVLKDNYRQFVFPIYVTTCVPLTFYAVAQFPLYLDLLRAILRNVPQPSDKGDAL